MMVEIVWLFGASIVAFCLGTAVGLLLAAWDADARMDELDDSELVDQDYWS